jgi:hypothetical protein
MSPFRVTVFRVRLLMLAAALALMGAAADKPGQPAKTSMGHAATKVSKRDPPSTTRKPKVPGNSAAAAPV